MELREHYLSLVTPEHADKPKYMSMLRNTFKYTDDIFALAVDLDDKFDVDQAEGAQLDVVSEFVGVNRQVAYDPYAGVSSILNDHLFRTILKAKICQNMWQGGIDELTEKWADVLPEYVLGIKDNMDMTMDVYMVGPTEPLLTELLQKGYIVPKPGGVRVNYYASEQALFAYDVDVPGLRGYDLGYWSKDITEYPAFSFEKDELHNRGYDQGYWI